MVTNGNQIEYYNQECNLFLPLILIVSKTTFVNLVILEESMSFLKHAALTLMVVSSAFAFADNGAGGGHGGSGKLPPEHAPRESRALRSGGTIGGNGMTADSATLEHRTLERIAASARGTNGTGN